MRRAEDLPPPAADALAASNLLCAHIGSDIQSAGGWIPFERYMHLALYAPGLGYYAGGATRLGPAGDFVTAPEMTPAFAQALATQVAQITASTAPAVLEFGAGSGALARDLIDRMRRLGAPLATYWILEPSPVMRAQQRRTLAAVEGIDLRWLDVPPTGFRGVVIANEVLDAMPVRLFVRTDDAVLERGVTMNAESTLGWRDQPADASLHQSVLALEAMCGPWPRPYLSEWPPLAAAWAGSLGQWLEHGAALLIDYGFPRAEFYHPQRSHGTLMCHYRHRAHADPLWLPGLSDITTHVDFTAIAEAAHDTGLDVLGYTSQGHFLLNCGVLDFVTQDAPDADPQAQARSSRSVQRLISEAEMGELFKVLALGRGVDVPLIGFAQGDRLYRL